MDRFDRVMQERELIAMHPEVAAMDKADRMRFVREKLRETEAKLVVTNADLTKLRDDSKWMEGAQAATQSLLEWAGVGPVLTGAAQNFYYRVISAERERQLLSLTPYRSLAKMCDSPSSPFDQREHLLVAVPFVVTRTYADLFDPDDIDQGEFRLPYDSCFFQYRESGRDSAALAWQEGEHIGLVEIISATPGWYVASCPFYFRGGKWQAESGDPQATNIATPRLGREVQAISILLDAEVAETEVVRAPHQLNKARLRKGRIPLNSYRTIDLRRRRRTDPVGGPGRGGPRLHFRRGHWRHYDGWKTWVRWCVVGDPDKGAVVSDYRV
jgi:hypothetical protein